MLIKMELARVVQWFNDLSAQAAQLKHAAAEKVACLDHHEIPPSRGGTGSSLSDGGEHHAEIVF